MNLNLLEAKSELVTLHLNAAPQAFDIVRQNGSRISLRGKSSAAAGMLARGMTCVVELPGRGRESLSILGISQNGQWLDLDCRFAGK